MVLNIDDMADAVIATLRRQNKGKWIGEMTDLQNHVGFYNMARDKRERVGGGRGMKVRYVMDHNNSAEHVGLFNTVNFSRDDAMVEGNIPWRFTDANMVWDEREEDINSGNAERIVEAVMVERSRAIASVVELGETATWGIPTSSSDNATPWGVQYWVVRNATLGYNGGNPTGFSSGRAGVSSTTYSRHKNFTGAYSTVTDTDNTGLVYMMEQAAKQMMWVAPSPEPGMGRSGYKTKIYTNWATWIALKNVTKGNNDSLGFDLSTPEPLFRGSELTYAPYFDSDSTNPLYMIDHNHTYATFLKDWYMKDIKIDRLPNQPHCFGGLISLVWNIVCDDVRKNAVFYAA